jgi:hypothetical protein
MPSKTKKELILEIFDRNSMTCLGEPEVHVIQKELGENQGGGMRCSRGYIVRVIAEAGRPVKITDAFALPVMEEPYTRAFEGFLKFGTLEQAERCLRAINSLHEGYRAAGDRKGMAYARSIVLVGKRRSQAAARRAGSVEIAALRREISEWFTMWLSAPRLFDDWIELRKRSPGFVKMFGAHECGT